MRGLGGKSDPFSSAVFLLICWRLQTTGKLNRAAKSCGERVVMQMLASGRE